MSIHDTDSADTLDNWLADSCELGHIFVDMKVTMTMEENQMMRAGNFVYGTLSPNRLATLFEDFRIAHSRYYVRMYNISHYIEMT